MAIGALAFSALPVPSAGAVPGNLQVATGEMLGAGYDRRPFYVSVDGRPWRLTYSGPDHTAAAGKLMNIRAAQALFDDERRTDDDPDGNTSRFIEWMDD